MNSPKARLLKDTARCNRLADLLANPDVEEALLIAFAEYCYRLSYGEDGQESSDHKRRGVVDFMPAFLNIATSSEVPKSPRPQQLK